MKTHNLAFLLIWFFFGCSSTADSDRKAQSIVDASIKAHGLSKLDQSTVSFDFRKKHFSMTLNKGRYRYESVEIKDGDSIENILSNKGFTQRVSHKAQSLTEKEATKYSNSLNSVIYFAFLPYFLNDPAAIKTYVGVDTIKAKPHHKIQVSFQKASGGDHHEDTFYYWFDEKTHLLNYLAYAAGGERFRSAYNRRNIRGLIIQDYINYKRPKMMDSVPLSEYQRYYEKGKLEELSRINLENISVSFN